MSATLGDGLLKPLPAYQLDQLSALVDESRRRSSVQLPGMFAYSESKGPTALGGLVRAGDAELRLYLTLVMVTSSGKDSDEFKRAWRKPMHNLMLGRALGYVPEDRDADRVKTASGGRLVGRAMDHLERDGLIVRRDSGLPHSPDIWVNHLASVDPKPHITVPLGMWRQGWISRLPKAALAVYLALRRHCYGREAEQIFISPAVRQGHYDLSASTWRRGAQELESAGLLTTEIRRVVDRRSPERPAMHFTLHSERLDFSQETVKKMLAAENGL